MEANGDEAYNEMDMKLILFVLVIEHCSCCALPIGRARERARGTIWWVKKDSHIIVFVVAWTMSSIRGLGFRIVFRSRQFRFNGSSSNTTTTTAAIFI